MTRTRFERRGMTLVEIMISLVLLGIVSGALMRVIMRQQRFYSGVNQIMTQRGQLRQGTSVLPIDLRSLSSSGNDIKEISDSAIVFDVNIGASVVCSVVSGTRVALPPEILNNKNTLTTFFGYGKPTGPEIARGVTVYIYNDSSTTGNVDDRWQRFDLVAMHASTTDCPGGPFMEIYDLGQERPVLQLSDPDGRVDASTGGPISRWIGVGAPVRLVKQVRYKLYQEADGLWYLGYSEHDNGSGAFSALSPVSGPYRPFATGSGAESGFSLRYYDVEGVQIAEGADSTNRTRIARIDIIARSQTASNVRAAGIQNGVSQQYADSLAVSIMLRNRR